MAMHRSRRARTIASLAAMAAFALALRGAASAADRNQAGAPPGDLNLDQVTRSVSIMIGIWQTCPPYFTIDKSRVEHVADIAYALGMSSFGDAFIPALGAEMERRNGEIAATGPEHWCVYQRGYQKMQLGVGSPFKD